MSLFPQTIPWDMVSEVTKSALARKFDKDFLLKIVYLVGCIMATYVPDPAPEEVKRFSSGKDAETELNEILSNLPSTKSNRVGVTAVDLATIWRIVQLVYTIITTAKK